MYLCPGIIFKSCFNFNIFLGGKGFLLRIPPLQNFLTRLRGKFDSESVFVFAVLGCNFRKNRPISPKFQYIDQIYRFVLHFKNIHRVIYTLFTESHQKFVLIIICCFLKTCLITTKFAYVFKAGNITLHLKNNHCIRHTFYRDSSKI